jgi:hypothetical protein
VLDKSGVIQGKNLYGAEVETTIAKVVASQPAKPAKQSKS